ncbi:MAG TPA: DUF4870 domain-containing protein [Terrimesophilobacter sp.]|jgi:Uncharacterized protein conserved in bacteria|uniref:DUF4870 domain-containing protein n=1 Tax=Terrimesophilobacter sp. TaxID=2906435 RepID=UPI002F95A1D7
MSESMPPPANPYQSAQPLSPADEKLWAVLVHLGGIFFNFLPALIGYLILKDRGPFVRQHTGSALNFQITLVIAYLVGVVTMLIIVGFFILAAAAIANVVFCILAAVAANKGEYYEYPIAIKFVK